ncbi:hypothetical protein GP486_001697 [Trichoglossum hirsutum]|uniref:CHAT domain-containing protein n=1 Tax=Trichoglossum hirsutum TaxID=265104 RepID=A0A9P8RSD7_9PEZI|nr:hypothetical protein GP486_001697 [Trichoglossum hirsutum]
MPLNAMALISFLSKWLVGIEDASDLSEEQRQILEHILMANVETDIFYSTCLALHIQAEDGGEVEDFDRAIECARQAQQNIPKEDHKYPSFLRSLGISLQHRSEITLSGPDADEAIKFNLEAYALLPDKHDDFPLFACSLGDSYRNRYELTNNVADLENAESYSYHAVEVSDHEHPDASVYHHYSLVLQAKFLRWPCLDNISECDKAIENSELAIRCHLGVPGDNSIESDPSKLASFRNTLSNALQLRYEMTGQPRDVDLAIEVAGEGLRTNPGKTMTLLLNQALGNAFIARFERTDQLADLAKAKEIFADVTKSLPKALSYRIPILTNRSTVLQCSFERTGNIADLNESISILESVDWLKAGSCRLVTKAAGNLSLALSCRYRSQGSFSDLNDAIEILISLLESMDRRDPIGLGSLNNVSLLLMWRYARQGLTKDLKLADAFSSDIFKQEQRYRLVYHWTTRSKVLVELSKTERRRTAVIKVLDEAIEKATYAVPRLRDDVGDPDHAIYLEQSARAALAKWEYCRSPVELLKRAIKEFGLAAKIVDEDNPDRYEYLFWRTEAEMQLPADTADHKLAIQHYQIILRSPVAVNSVKVRSGHALAKLLGTRGDIGKASDILMDSVRLLQDVAPLQVELVDRQFLLAGFGQLISDTAMVMAAAEKPTIEIVQTLEQGRGIILSQILDSRSDLTDLKKKYPCLALRLQKAREALDLNTGTSVKFATTKGSHSYMRRTPKHLAAQEFRDVISLIQSKTEFNNFLRPPVEEDLISVSTLGAIVLVSVGNSQAYGLEEGKEACAHLLHNGTFTTVRLPGLHSSKLKSKSKSFRLALEDIRVRPDTASDKLKDILNWLYEVVVEPVLISLKFKKPKDRGEPLPRIWWVAGGLLSGLPLHAAGRYPPSPNSPADNAFDRIISSYAPTVKTLLYSRETLAKASPPSVSLELERDVALMIAMPKTKGQDDLINAETEVEYIRSLLLPSGMDCRVLREPDVESTLQALKFANYAHFSCHGKSDPRDPSKSSLLLRNCQTRTLDVRTITRQHLQSPRLAYLSACQTLDSPAQDLREECIHITSAFQSAGFPHVVGTLWSVWDECSMKVAVRFYRSLLNDEGRVDIGGSRVAFALHEAVTSLRAQGADPLKWAPYVHSGC